VRSFAVAVFPQTWEMLLGSVLLISILFLPEGLGSIVLRWRRTQAGAP
jgi:branched-chain amino acid transport system permease protein